MFRKPRINLPLFPWSFLQYVFVDSGILGCYNWGLLQRFRCLASCITKETSIKEKTQNYFHFSSSLIQYNTQNIHNIHPHTSKSLT